MRIAKVNTSLRGTNMLPTAPIPEDLKAAPIHLTDNARTVLQKRYVRRGADGKPAETEHEMFWRVAYHVALAEAEFADDETIMAQARAYFDLLTNLRFFPNSPTFTGAGTPLGQLAACFTENMRVTTVNGLKRIADLRDGDLVLTHRGRYRPVRHAYKREYAGELLTIKIHNIGTPLEVTPEHPILTMNGWVNAGDLKVGDWVAIGALEGAESFVAFDLATIECTADLEMQTSESAVRVRRPSTYQNSGLSARWMNRFIPLSTDLARLCGYYVSEGTLGSDDEYVRFTFSREETDYQQDVKEHYVRIRARRIDNRAYYQIKSVQANSFSGTVYNCEVEEDNTYVTEGVVVHNCFVLAIDDDMGRTESGIFQTLRDAALIQQTGGGNGFAFSRLRPKGALVNSSRGEATGPVGFLRVYDQAFGEIAQGGCLTPDTLVFTEKGLLRLDELVTHESVGWRDHSLAVATDEGERHSPSVYNNGVEAVLRVSTAEGLILRGTPNHKVKVLTAQGMVWRRLDALQTGDALVVKLGQHRGVLQALRTPDGGSVMLDSDLAHALGLFMGGKTVDVKSAALFAANGITRNALPRQIRRSASLEVCAFLEGLSDAQLTPQLQHEVAVLALGVGYSYRMPCTVHSMVGDSLQTDLGFVKVTSVDPDGESLTLDLEVEGNHTYLANGIVTHNSRRGANMAVLRVDHPDIREFITAKTDESAITNFNISVGITDAFMSAVENDTDFDLINPQNGEVWETVRARDLFDLIVKQAHHNGEPGVLFLDAANRSNPVPNLYVLESTNPCGEQFLGPFENCCLGSINLAQLPVKNGSPDWKTLQAWTELSTRFLDDVVSANSYVPSVPQLAEAAHRVRRIGLGVMGLADLMYKLNVRYGSAEGQEFAGQITEFVRYHTMKTSIALAKERGAFPAIKGSIYDPDDLKWQPPTPLFPYSRDWGRPSLDWDKITKGIKKNGIRNGAQMTVAPTGCLVAGSMVVTDQGILPIEQLGDLRGAQWQDVSFNVASEGGVLPATQFYLNGRAQTLKVTTKRGYTLQGTVGHRIRVWQDGAWEWRRMDEVQAGMQVPLKATGLIGAPKLVPLETGIASNFHTTPLTLPSHMTADLAYLLGFFMGDGSLKTRSLRFAISDEASEKWLTELLQKTFGVTPTVALDERSPKLKSLEVHSVNLVAFWQQNGFAKIAPHAEHCGKGYQPHIPRAVLRTNDEAIYAAFLAGLFDADATIHLKRLVSWLTTDRQFHDQVKALLLAMGIFTTTDLQTTGLGQSTAYRLRTAHVQATQKLVEKLPYLCRIIPTGTARRQTLRDGIPITRQEHHLALRLADRGAEHARVQSWRQRQYNVSRGSLSQFVEGHREAMLTNGLESLVATIDDEIYYDEVVAVEDGGWQDTYDISVPGTHAYVANGLISHNTIATVSGCEGYGCEPVFALAYIRHVNDKGRDLQLQYTSPLFEQALQQAKLAPEQIQRIVEYVNAHGSCQGAPDLPDHIRHTFVVSGDITAEEHIRMQAAMQRFVDNAISKTCNFFSDATPNDVATAYQLGWKLGCKGLTVYVTGSRDKVVLETHATAKTKDGEAQPEAATTSALAMGGDSQLAALNGDHDHDPQPQMLFPEAKKPRPRRLEGRTYRIGTPLGGTYITINENGQGRGHPFELFIHTSKAGSETAAISEAIGRLSSLIMRMASPILPRDRVKEIIRQLEGIGGDRAIGFGPQRVRSLPDGIAQVLREYLDETSDVEEDYAPLPEVRSAEPRPLLKSAGNATIPPQAQLTLIGDLCPECGEASMVNEEGCRKCYNCGYSEC